MVEVKQERDARGSENQNSMHDQDVGETAGVRDNSQIPAGATGGNRANGEIPIGNNVRIGSYVSFLIFL